MIELLDPDRVCHCVFCDGDDRAQEHGHAAGQMCEHGCQDNTTELVTRYGWSVTAVQSGDGVPPWAYTIGLWHTLGSAEVAMFGLRQPDMHKWINLIGEQIRDGSSLSVDRQVDGILPGGFPLLIKPVNRGWYRYYFGTALRFYRRPPLPIVQAVWPDRDGRFPWDEDAGANCRANQPQLWLAPEQHPANMWRDLETITPWPFPDEVRTQVYTTTRIVEGQEPVRGVLHDQDGHWEFLDGLELTEDSIAVVHLHQLYAQHPGLAGFAALTPGRQAWLNSDEMWTESALPPQENLPTDG
jgi:hypothetical protein